MGRDGYAGLVCLALSVGLLALTRGLPQSSFVPVGPDFYPRIVLVIMAVLSVMLIAEDAWSRRRRSAAATAAVTPHDVRNYPLVAATFAAFTGYVFLLPLCGFRIATFAFVVVLQAVFERPRGWRHWLTIVVVGLATVLVTYLAFETYLSVLLPRGRWIEL